MLKPDGSKYTRLEMEEQIRKVWNKQIWIRMKAVSDLKLPHVPVYDMPKGILIHYILDNMVMWNQIDGVCAGVDVSSYTQPEYLPKFAQTLGYLIQTGHAMTPDETDGVPMSLIPTQPPQTQNQATTWTPPQAPAAPAGFPPPPPSFPTQGPPVPPFPNASPPPPPPIPTPGVAGQIPPPPVPAVNASAPVAATTQTPVSTISVEADASAEAGEKPKRGRPKGSKNLPKAVSQPEQVAQQAMAAQAAAIAPPPPMPSAPTPPPMVNVQATPIPQSLGAQGVPVPTMAPPLPPVPAFVAQPVPQVGPSYEELMTKVGDLTALVTKLLGEAESNRTTMENLLKHIGAMEAGLAFCISTEAWRQNKLQGPSMDFQAVLMALGVSFS